MRILMLSDVYFPRVNGVSTAIQTYRQLLRSHNISSRLLVPRYGTEVTDNSAEDIERLAAWTVPMDHEDRIVRPGLFRKRAIAAAKNCDVLHIQTPFAAHGAGVAAARKLGLPVVASYHTLFEEYLHHYAPFIPSSWLRGLARRISRRQCNELDAVIVPSTPMKERLLEYGVTTPIHILPTGIPLERFAQGNRERFRLRYQIELERPLALYVGRAAHEKNIDFLIDATRIALKTQPRLLLLIAGEGPALNALQAQVRKLGMSDAVRFVGYLDRSSELPDCYAAADLFVFASHTETQGLVLLEAMAAGLPVVALAKMGTCDILVEASGAIAPAAELAPFAGAMARVAGDATLRQSMRAKGLAWSAHWSDHALTTRLVDLYRQLALHTSPEETSWKAHSKEKPA